MKQEIEEQHQQLIYYRDKFWLWWYKFLTKWL